MTVAELTSVGQFTLTDREPPRPAAGELLVRVAAVGICGSDMHAFSEGGVGDRLCQFPMVLGHEPSGVVEGVGEGVTGWSRGDRASLEPAIFCYHCKFCLAGHNNLCENLRFMSSSQALPGFFRELVTLPAINALPIRATTSLEAATLVEPLAVILHSLDLGHFSAGEDAIVAGCGPIGLLTIAVLRLRGARRIWAVEPLAHRRAMALRLGADEALAPEDFTSLCRVADIAFDCAAHGDTVNRCLNALKGFGRLVLTGIHAEKSLDLDIHLMRRTELRLYCARRSNTEAHEACQLLEENLALFLPMLTHRRKLHEIEAAFRMNRNYEDGVVKMLIV